MRILFVHQNFPGQFKHLASALAADPKNEVVAIGDIKKAGQQLQLPGVKMLCYETPQGVSSSTHNYIHNLEAGIRRGQQVCRLILKLRENGFVPDIICCHPAWGEGLYLKNIFPDAKLLHFYEFFYRARGGDVNFDPEFPNTLDDNLRVRTKNTIQLLSLVDADHGLSPTHWQWSQYPPEFREKISVIFDGIDTDQIRPNPEATIELNGFGKVTSTDEVVTFVSRGLEPYRGIHTFIRALPEILRQRPNALIIIVGTDQVSYGSELETGTYRQKYLTEIEGQADLSRVYFVGHLPREQLTKVLQLSSVHVYLTYPFVLSWSMLEAMSAGALVIGSRTPPVQEVIEDGCNGLLVDFFNPMEIAEVVNRIFNHPDRMKSLREKARQTILQRYDLKTICLPKQVELIHTLLNNSLK
jgi:glycosyltransferase involved in cell wall biosynthesis